MADAGTLAQDYHDLTVRELSTKNVQVDEIWSFVGSKDKNVQQKNWGKGQGDNWTWVAFDADSKLVINWLTAGRDSSAGTAFLTDMSERLANRIQLTSDGHAVYPGAVARVFGPNGVDYAQLIKHYAVERMGYARYSPPICVGCEKKSMAGLPDRNQVSTSFVERQNLTLRMQSRRFTRLTNGFSKTQQNHHYAIALHYFCYNFIRKHQAIKTTPAVMAGVSDKEWTMVDFVKLLEREEQLLGGRLTDYKMAASKRQSNNG